MNLLKSGVFTQYFGDKKDSAISIEVKCILLEQKSKFQNILIFDSFNYGCTLAIDGIIRSTEKFGVFYHEMISFLAICVHPHPHRVCIIGGGDGGVATEVCRHHLVESVDLVEFDDSLLSISKTHLSFSSFGLTNTKTTVHVMDGFEFLRHAKHQYDIIIIDSFETCGVTFSSFNCEHFRLIYNALSVDGLMIAKGESLCLELPRIQRFMKDCRAVFPRANYAYNLVPTSPSGYSGYIIASKNPDANLHSPIHPPPANCKCYSAELHKAAFSLPASYIKALGP